MPANLLVSYKYISSHIFKASFALLERIVLSTSPAIVSNLVEGVDATSVFFSAVSHLPIWIIIYQQRMNPEQYSLPLPNGHNHLQELRL